MVRGDRNRCLSTMAAHSGALLGISTERCKGRLSPGSIPSASAIVGQTSGQEKVSPLVTLKVSLAAPDEVAAHARARASRSASTASDTLAAPPGYHSGHPASRSTAA